MTYTEKNYFEPVEFYCKCGRPECDAPKQMNPMLLAKINDLREVYGKPIFISSGLRCEYWNKKKGGVADSGHQDGTEVDIKCQSSRERYELLRLVFQYDLFDRIGIGNGFIHLGVSKRLTPEVVWTYYPKG